MGSVWLAEDDHRRQQRVALKFIPDELVSDPQALNLLLDETQITLQLSHPSIVRTHDVARNAQLAAISMEYLEEGSLHQHRLKQPARCFSANKLRPWLAQAISALRYAHEDVGIVHRDIKPPNLLLTKKFEVKVGDFGIAAPITDSLSRISTRPALATAGTRAYMSPQQMTGSIPSWERRRSAEGVSQHILTECVNLTHFKCSRTRLQPKVTGSTLDA
jgi:serine/threonine protein kinase